MIRVKFKHLYVVSLLFVFSLVTPSPLSAENSVGNSGAVVVDDWDGYDSVALVHRGKNGIWFPIAMANDILSELKHCDLSAIEFHLQEEKLHLLDSQLKLKDRRIQDLYSAISLSKKLEDKMQATIDLAESSRHRSDEAARRAEEAKNAWYRHPVLWLGVGVVLTSACFIFVPLASN
ncbi:MAG TPA: hypothetical protein VMW10_06735 [Alphaproteobacteria bacterium]|nr:hypothetical protein [Alphaproteobacteria bacterium]